MQNQQSVATTNSETHATLVAKILGGSGSAIVGWGGGALVFAVTLLRSAWRFDLFDTDALVWLFVVPLCAIAGAGSGVVFWQFTDRLDAWRFAAGD